jgi:hypothetical protein
VTHVEVQAQVRLTLGFAQVLARVKQHVFLDTAELFHFSSFNILFIF